MIKKQLKFLNNVNKNMNFYYELKVKNKIIRI